MPHANIEVKMFPTNESDEIQDDFFQPIARESSLSDRVTRQIEKFLLDNKLQPGERLPPERELARQFDVSRTVIREAVRALVAKGLLEVKMGSGTVVRRPSARSVAQSIAIFLRGEKIEPEFTKILEVRRILEVEIAGLAAQRRTDEHIERLQEILEQAETYQGDRSKFAALDVKFHAALAEATQNELFSLLLDTLSDLMLQLRYMAFEVPGMTQRAIRLHNSIFNQVKARDADGARQAMIAHLTESEATMNEIAEKYAR
jgi:GntR family transcriptional repressor for pyruvate dehydrogenase complex